MKEIQFSDHSRLKIEVLARHGITIDPEFVIETVRSPDKLETSESNKLIAQKRIDENRVLRVIIKSLVHLFWLLPFTLVGGLDMKKIRYSKDVDALLIELLDEPIAYAEDEGQVILHYSPNAKLVLAEIL